MTHLQRLQVRQSELRQRVNELLGVEQLSEEQQTELDSATTELQGIEPKMRAAILAAEEGAEEGDEDGDEDGQQRADELDAELREAQAIAGRARLGRYVAAVMGGAQITGAEAELNQALGMRADQIPLVMLVPCDAEDEGIPGQRAEDAPTYYRADAVTDLNALDVPRTPGRFLARVFPLNAARFLGVTFESVPVGDRVHTVFGSGATADTVARGAEKDAEAAALSAVVMSPNRITARYLFEIEDVGRIPQLESRLRQDLSMSMSAQLDNAIFNGDDQLTTPQGLKALVGVQNQELSGYTAAKFGDVFDEAKVLLDGDYAAMFSDCRLVWAAAAFRDKGLLAYSDTIPTRLYEHLRSLGLGQTTTTHIAGDAVAVNDPWAFGSRGRGRDGAAVAAIWPSMQLIRDPYTQAAKGQVALTAIQLWDFALIRAANFIHFEAKTLA